MKDKKAQLAVETLLMYGIVLLIVAVAIAALIGFGVFDLKGILPEKCEITGVKITCDDYLVMTGRGGVRLSLVNSIGDNINVQSIRVYGEGDNTGLWGLLGGCMYTPNATDSTPRSTSTIPPSTPAFMLVNGERATFTLTNCDIKIPAGKRIEGKLLINYTKVGNDLVKPAMGNIFVTVG